MGFGPQPTGAIAPSFAPSTSSCAAGPSFRPCSSSLCTLRSSGLHFGLSGGDPWFMARACLFFLAYTLIILLVEGNGITYEAQSTSASEGCSAACLVPSSDWLSSSFALSASQDLESACGAPFQGSQFPCQNQVRNGGYFLDGMDVRDMQKDAVAKCLVLRPLWPELGSLCYRGWSAQVTVLSSTGVGALMAGATENQEPTAAKPPQIPQEEQTGCPAMEPIRQCTKTGFRSRGIVLACASVLVSSTSFTWTERFWQRLCAVPYEHGLSTSAAPANADGPADPAWYALDAAAYANHVCNAFHAASCGCFCCCPTTAGDLAARSGSRCQVANECPAEAQQDYAGGQKGRQFVSRVSAVGAHRDEERRQGKHGCAFGSCQGIGRYQGGSARARKCPSPALVTVASVLAAVCQQMEGIHLPVPSLRDGIPWSHAGSHQQSEKSPAEGGLCQKESGHCGSRWFRLPFVRGRDGRCRQQGRGGASTRRECTAHSRRAQSSGIQPCSVIRIGRQIGAQAQKAAHKRGRRCLYSKACDAQSSAFSQGRHYMTFEYECQWPQATVDPVAAPMHWGHSIVNEKCFLSPWSAIESASDLAYAVGAPGEIKIDEVLFCKTARSCKAVRFHPDVEVFQGKDSEREFLTRHVGLNDVQWPMAPQTCPSRDGNARQGCPTEPSASAGSASGRHFLDRRLPADVPSYIHHLQHLWRDDLCRLPLDQPYQVRTWYIHHEHQQQWKIPRPGDGTSWHRLILERWRDQIHNDAVLNIAVVFPQLRTAPEAMPVHADLILVQGSHAFCGGITTVYPPDDDTGQGYTWAASYPRHVGGVGILVGVDAGELLQTHACDIFHAGTHIPTTTAPTHWMANGHSFIAVFQDLQGLRPAVVAPAVPVATPDAVSNEAEEAFSGSSPEIGAPSPEEAEESLPLTDSSFDEEELQGVHIFQLGRPVHHAFLRWRTYNLILFDMLHAVGLHRDLAVGFHVLQAPLIDQHQADEAVILQRVGDIPAASDSKLVVVDMVLPATSSGAEQSLRETRILPRLLSRLGLLHALGLHTACGADTSSAACVVYFNNVLWAPTGTDLRPIDHGAYIRIVVPQSHDRQESEIRAKRPIQQCAPGASAGSAKASRVARPSTRQASDDSDASSMIQAPPILECHQSCGPLAPRTCSATFPSLAPTHRHTSLGAPRISAMDASSTYGIS